VIAKKEDPTTHERFIDVLKQAPQSASNVATLLSAGRLVDVFWFRLSTSLQVRAPFLPLESITSTAV
jgi:hypothetical protein